MDYLDLSKLAISNLWRTKLRTFLTVLGVIIGIGALSSMISFGVGMQKNFTDEFKKNDFFTSITVTAKKITLEDISSGNLENIEKSMQQKTTPLNDSVIEEINKINGVALAFPEIKFPVNIEFNGKTTTQNLYAIPIGMSAYFPLKELKYGTFLTSDSSHEILLTEDVLKSLSITLNKHETDTSDNTLLQVDSLINKDILVISKIVDFRKILKNPFFALMARQKVPFKDTTFHFTVKGIIPAKNEFGYNRFGSGVYAPIKTAKKIPGLDFASAWDILKSKNQDEGYGSIYIRTKNFKDIHQIRGNEINKSNS